MPSSAVQRVLDRLSDRGLRSAGPNRWKARCPAHDDQNPSLSIAEGQDGKALVHCQAGCEPASVVRALDLTESDLFELADRQQSRSRLTPPRRTIAATYPYPDETGQLLFEVVRYNPKGFLQRRPGEQGGWSYDLADTRRVIYRLPQVIQAVQRGDVVFVVEGEKDVHALERLGAAATTNPMGAGKWRPEYSESLRGARVCLIPDNDSAGRKHVDEVARALAGIAAEINILELPDTPDKGDVSDWVAAGGTLEDLLRLYETACRAPNFAEPAPAEPAGADAEAHDRPPPRCRYRLMRDLLDDPTTLEPPRVVAPRLAWAGRLSLLAAREKAGKSTLAGAAAAAVSAGRSFLGEPTPKGRVLWLCLEEHQSDFVRRLHAMNADPAMVIVAEAPEEIEDLHQLIAHIRPSLAVVDTLSALTRGWVSEENDASGWTPVMQDLGRMVHQTDTALLLLHHAKKNGKEYRGSTAIGAGVDMLLTMTNGDGADEEEEGDDSIRLLTSRGRWPAETFRVRYQEDSFTLAAGRQTLAERVLDAIVTHPGATKNRVESAVGAQRKATLACIDALIAAGRVVDRGTAAGAALYAVEDSSPAGGSESQGETVGTENHAPEREDVLGVVAGELQLEDEEFDQASPDCGSGNLQEGDEPNEVVREPVFDVESRDDIDLFQRELEESHTPGLLEERARRASELRTRLPERLIDTFEERAGMLEHEGGYPREVAEAIALEALLEDASDHDALGAA